MSKLTYVSFKAATLTVGSNLLGWWTGMMNREPHMLEVTERGVLNSLITGEYVLDGEKPIAATGVFEARSKTGDRLFLEGLRVVELGSTVVEPAYRGQGIGKGIMKSSLSAARSCGLFIPVGVSTNPIVHHIFEGLGGQPMDDSPKLAELRNQLCLCEEASPDCKLCPLAKRGGWIFFPYMRQRREYSDFHGL